MRADIRVERAITPRPNGKIIDVGEHSRQLARVRVRSRRHVVRGDMQPCKLRQHLRAVAEIQRPAYDARDRLAVDLKVPPRRLQAKRQVGRSQRLAVGREIDDLKFPAQKQSRSRPRRNLAPEQRPPVIKIHGPQLAVQAQSVAGRQ